MEMNSLGTTASTKQKKDFFNATIGLAWTLTLLPTYKPATDVKFAALMTVHPPLSCPAFRNPRNPTNAYTLTFLVPSKRLTVARNLFSA
jgi:hypothetical protein